MDKMRRTLPLRITWGDGERPSAAKYNALADQARNGTNILEKAIGDPWNQSGDAMLSADFPLQIPNLARMIGENKYLCPPLYPVLNEFRFYEYIGTKYIGKTDGYLLFPPKNSGTFDVFIAGAGFAGSRQTNEYDVTGANGYYVDDTTGRFHTAMPLTVGEVVDYDVDPPNEWLIGQETLPGVLPDPRQGDFTGVRVSKIGSVFYIHLPPRRPLTLSTRESPANYPVFGSEWTANAGSSTSPFLFWNSNLTAVANAHYRYALPGELQDIWATIAIGQEMPAGYMYLWNSTDKVIIEDIVFKKTTDSYIFEVSSATFDFNAVTTSTEVEANYTSTNLQLIVCGTSLARAIWAQQSFNYRHNHNKSVALESTVSHNDLTSTNPPTSAATSHSARYPTYLPAWNASRWNNDTHPYLLSRAGSQPTSARYRDTYNNAMLGHLLLANADTSGADNYLDDALPNQSFSMYFGSIPGGRLYYDVVSGLVTDAREVDATNVPGFTGVGKGSQAGLKGIGGATGYGVHGESSASDGIYGISSAATKYGVYGYSAVGGGVKGETIVNGKYGILGISSNITAGIGVYGSSVAGNGVYGISSNNVGVVGVTSAADPGGGLCVPGVLGKAGVGAGRAGIVGKGFTNDDLVYPGFATSVGVIGIAETGYGVVANGGEISPNYAALRIVPQDIDPAVKTAGDLVINASTGKLRVADGTNWNRVVHNVYANSNVAATLTASTTDEQDFEDVKYNVSAGTLVVGSTVRIRAQFYIGDNVGGVDTCTVRLYLGGAAIWFQVFTCHDTDIYSCHLDLIIHIRTATTQYSGGIFSYKLGTATAVTSPTDSNIGIVTASANDIKISVQWNDTDAQADAILTNLCIDMT